MGKYLLGTTTCLAVLLLACSASASQWQHKVIHSGLTFLDGNQRNYGVSPDGVGIYTGIGPGYQGLQAWKMGESVNDLYLGESVARARAINGANQVAFNGATDDSFHVNVDGRDFFVEVYGMTTSSRYANVMYNGLDEYGLPLWYVRDSQESRTHVYHGDQELAGDVRNTNVFMLNMNHPGDVVWRSISHPSTGAETSLYLNGTDLAIDTLGTNRVITPGAGINDNGDVLWSGFGDKIGGKWHLFLGTRDLTIEHGLLERQGRGYQVTNSGHLLWNQFALDNHVHLMKDFTDLSSIAYAGAVHGIDELQAFMNERGDVGWTGAADGAMEPRRVFFNTTDISTDLLDQSGGNDTAITVGIDERSNVLWMGQGAKTNHRREVFVNRFNLSADALGATPYRWAGAFAIGENGHVLWSAQELDGTFTMYLSTPVPEPSVCLVLALAPLLWKCRRKAS